MTKLVELLGWRKKSMLFCSSHVAVFILGISTPLLSVDLIGKRIKSYSEFNIKFNCMQLTCFMKNSFDTNLCEYGNFHVGVNLAFFVILPSFSHRTIKPILIESRPSVGSRLTNLSRGWYDVTNTSRGGSRDWDVTSYHPRLRFVCLDPPLGLDYFSRTSFRYVNKEKYANNVLFNATATLWRCGKRCALRCDVIITYLNEQ